MSLHAEEQRLDDRKNDTHCFTERLIIARKRIIKKVQ